MTTLRNLRRRVNLTQQEFADLLETPLNTFRMWDSGLRAAPAHILRQARKTTVNYARHTQLLSLSKLAAEFGVHVRTPQAAARTGRLDAIFYERSVFGRPRRLASRTAGQKFMETHYRRFAGQPLCPPPLPSVPDDFDHRLRDLRSRLHLSQQALASRIGAASKAVVYQWQSRKRTPSPVFWQRIQELGSDS